MAPSVGRYSNCTGVSSGKRFPKSSASVCAPEESPATANAKAAAYSTSRPFPILSAARARRFAAAPFPKWARSEERREGKSVDLGGGRDTKKKRKNRKP